MEMGFEMTQAKAARLAGLVIFPELRTLVYPYGMVPMFFYEVGLGFWLLIKGVKLPEKNSA